MGRRQAQAGAAADQDRIVSGGGVGGHFGRARVGHSANVR
jgi:hypothetical protein